MLTWDWISGASGKMFEQEEITGPSASTQVELGNCEKHPAPSAPLIGQRKCASRNSKVRAARPSAI
jgi:hypothetical protein